jgi:YgiT-type zinc finger domain-containing protein
MGQRKPGFTSFTAEQDERVIVVRKIPATICDTCGEAYFNEEVALRLDEIIDSFLATTGEVKVCEYEQPIAA